MGINGLLPLLSEGMETECKIETMEGKKAGIDISGWMHKCKDKDLNLSHKYQYQPIYKRLMLLRLHGVEPVVVFDGDDVPAKQQVIQKRREYMQKRKQEADELMKQGKVKEAMKKKRDAFNTTPQMQENIKLFCRNNNFGYVQAPFEADAQLAFLMKTGAIDFVISEDSDMIVYGCSEIMFKLKIDDSGGIGDMFKQSAIEKCWEKSFDEACLRAACILNGCDYFPGGLYGFGSIKISTVYCNLERPFSFANLMDVNPVAVTDTAFKDKFLVADNTFKYHLVYDPETRLIGPVTAYPAGMSAEDFPYCGNLTLAKGDHFFPYKKRDITPIILGGPLLITQSFLCNKCEPTEMFATVAELKTHRENVHPFTCPHCQKSFRDTQYYKQHLENVHPKEKAFICGTLDCGKAFATPYKLARHEKSHGPATVPCPVCGQRFKRSDTMKEHLLIHKDKRTFKCETCGAGFNNSQSLASHKVTHVTEKSHPCDQYDLKFASYQRLKTHQKIVHIGETRYSCKVCGKGFFGICQLKRHEPFCQRRNEYTVKCETCGKKFESRERMSQHMRRVHKMLLGRAPSTAPRPFKCESCDEWFTSISARSHHKKRYHSANVSTGPKPFPCGICGSRHINEEARSWHMRHKHKMTKANLASLSTTN